MRPLPGQGLHLLLRKRGLMLRGLDWVAHLLHTPTMLGRGAARARWHHRIHLVPYAVIRPVCDRYEQNLGGEA